MAAKDLLSLNGAFEAQIGEARLDHRRQQRDQCVRFRALCGIGVALRAVEMQRGPAGQSAPALDETAHLQQHAAHIAMFDNRYRARRRRSGPAGARAHRRRLGCRRHLPDPAPECPPSAFRRSSW
jgi:hypothetical protein